MNKIKSLVTALSCLLCTSVLAQNVSYDPSSVVAEWSDDSRTKLIVDINFSSSTMPDTWTGETGRDCPSYADGGYVNTVLEIPIEGADGWPMLFHHCTFANKQSYNGFAGATAAFCRQYYLGEGVTGNGSYPNNWSVEGHKVYLEDNITYGANGKPNYGEAGFVQMCRDASQDNVTSMHGWVEIDHLPYVEKVQWSWSSTSWGRGIKCDYKVGNGEWKPLVWMGSNRHKNGYTSYSDQGYLMENIIDAEDVSLRWRVWDGDDATTLVQTNEDGTSFFNTAINPLAQQQAPRVHKIKIYGNPVTEEQATFARENPLADVGKITEFEKPGEEVSEAPDAHATLVFFSVAKDGTADYTTVQAAIDAVPDGKRGIIFIKNGVYEENIYAGTKSEKNKFISLIGESREGTILTSNVSRGGDNGKSYLDCSALNVFVERFYAENLTIRNTSGNVGQAEALFTAGDGHIFKNCTITGFQDTYKSDNNARGYFVGCFIEGATDFIYGGGLEWFEQCQINCVQGGKYITAAAESWTPMTKILYPELETADAFYPGLFFNQCRVTSSEGVAAGSYYLGRPWKQTAGTVFMNCILGNHIHPAGWSAWDGSEETASYYEYKNVGTDGKLVDTSKRVSFGHQATDKEYAAYFNTEFLYTNASKVPFVPSEILNVGTPANFETMGNILTWTADDSQVAWMVFADDRYVTTVTQPSYTRPNADESVTYYIKGITRHGITSEAVEAQGKERLKAFLTAEGFGKYATGGRGGEVVIVTSLADDGSEGTLRWAFNQYAGKPITIVFAISGEIKLNSALKVKRADWTLAGQTAPGDGILITHHKVNFGGSENFIVRNVRFRVGQKDTAGNIIAENACGAENCQNFIFDHCTFGWSVEENMNAFDSHFHTVQYCIVHEGLYNAGHSKGVRGYGCQWGGSPATYHHNLLAHNKSRSCRFNGARGEDHVVFLEYINNVNYNWGNATACYGGENTAEINEYNGLNSAHECNFIANYYKPGPATSSDSKFINSSYAREGAKSWAPAKWYLEGNVMEGNTSITTSNWNGVSAEVYSARQIRSNEKLTPSLPYYKYSVTGNIGQYDYNLYALTSYETAEAAFETVLAKAGTINRDRVEKRVVEDVRSGKATYGGSFGANKGIIDTENDAEGFYAYNNIYVVDTDTDKDGMPDYWERANGLNPNVADQNMPNLDGYTALEVYLGSLMGEQLDASFAEAITDVEINPTTLQWNPSDATVHVDESAIGSCLSVYSASGSFIENIYVHTTQVSLEKLPSGIYLVQLNGKQITPRVLKCVK